MVRCVSVKLLNETSLACQTTCWLGKKIIKCKENEISTWKIKFDIHHVTTVARKALRNRGYPKEYLLKVSSVSVRHEVSGSPLIAF